jgi:hypothetical protein
MTRLPRTLLLLSLVTLFALPATGFAGERRSHRRTVESPQSSHRASRAGIESRHIHRYGAGHRNTRVVVTQPRIVVTGPRVIVSSGPVYPRRYIEPMYLGHDAFHGVLSDLGRARFEDERLAIIHHVARNYTVTVGQVQAMVGTLRFSNSRVDALVDLHSRVRDRQNWYQVYDLLTFSSDRRELRLRCGY